MQRMQRNGISFIYLTHTTSKNEGFLVSAFSQWTRKVQSICHFK